MIPSILFGAAVLLAFLLPGLLGSKISVSPWSNDSMEKFHVPQSWLDNPDDFVTVEPPAPVFTRDSNCFDSNFKWAHFQRGLWAPA